MREVELVRGRKQLPYDRAEQGGHSIRMSLTGHLGAVSFSYVPDLPCWDELKAILRASFGDDEFYRRHYTYPQGIDLSYHSRRPLREWQVEQEEKDARPDEFLGAPFECDLLVEGRCWSDGSITRALEMSPLIQAEGEEPMWEYLAYYYHQTFYPEDDMEVAEFGDLMLSMAKILGA